MTSSKKLIPLSIAIFVIIVVFSISYYTLQQFTFAGDKIFYGKKQSVLAAEIREELLKRKDSQSVMFKTSDGINLSGFLIKRPNAIANILLCHGYKGSKEFLYGLLNIFPKFNILMFDFRAHGQSDGHITSIGCHEYKDVIAAAKYLQKTTTNLKTKKKIPFIILGISMGGASSLKAIENNPQLCDALIIDSTFSDLDKMFLRAFNAKVKLPHYPFFTVLRAMFHYFGNCDIKKMRPVNCVKKIRQPIYFIHSCSDTFIKPENSVELYANAINKKTRLWIAPRCRHGWLATYHPQKYRRKVERFLNKTLFVKNPI